jgi:hypothetical protein
MIELPIFHHSSSTQTLKEVGLDFKLEDCEIKLTTFFNINALAEYIGDNEEQYTSIFCNGSEFICSLSYNEIKSIFNTEKTKK